MRKGELSTKQRRMIAALLICPTIGEACSQAGIGRTTLSRWLDYPAFVSALSDAEAELVGEAARRLVTGGGKALDCIDKILTSSPHENLRLRAAESWLDLSLRLRELQIERRLAELEEKVYGDKH